MISRILPQFLSALILLMVFAGQTSAQTKEDRAGDRCAYDLEEILSLSEHEFDQDLSGGWRALASDADCRSAAADLIKHYRDVRDLSSSSLFWHEGQLRAFVGETHRARVLMESSRKPPEEDLAGWNAYVDATLAFLEGDLTKLVLARERLASVPASPDLPPVKDGFIELVDGEGRTMRMSWPPNLDVVDGLIRCFGAPYEEAYGSTCRERFPSPRREVAR